MNEEKTIKADAVPYIAFESVQARNERHFKRLWIIILVLIGALIVSILATFTWIWYLYNVDFESYEVDMDAGQGDALYNYIGEDGDIYNGTDKNTTEENNEGGRTG